MPDEDDGVEIPMECVLIWGGRLRSRTLQRLGSSLSVGRLTDNTSALAVAQPTDWQITIQTTQLICQQTDCTSGLTA